MSFPIRTLVRTSHYQHEGMVAKGGPSGRHSQVVFPFFVLSGFARIKGSLIWSELIQTISRTLPTSAMPWKFPGLLRPFSPINIQSEKSLTILEGSTRFSYLNIDAISFRHSEKPGADSKVDPKSIYLRMLLLEHAGLCVPRRTSIFSPD